jgi:pimeloyl-ACP methyl ester carboxylesterase
MMDGLAAVTNILGYAGFGQLLRLTGHGLLDAALAPFGRAHYIPIVGKPGQLGMMTSEDAEAGYLALVPPGFRNEVAARIALTAGLYRPVRHAGRVRCPVLVQVCERDSVAPGAAAERVITRLGSHAEAKRYPIGHFEPYFGAHFERSVSDQLAFLRRHLRP